MGFDFDTLEALKKEPQDHWPDEAEDMYERVTVIGRGSFGLVWMAQRKTPPVDDNDDEFVALKNIKIKDRKGLIFAQREIAILSELHHPNVIRLIRAFPIHRSPPNTTQTQLVSMQLARGPDLQALVTERGALGLPLVRLVSRQLIAAVSYLHGRGVLHRDIKPANLVLENRKLAPDDDYDWETDDDLWSDGEVAKKNTQNEKWNLLLIDFGFARALTKKEILDTPIHLRSSIVNEAQSMIDAAKVVSELDESSDGDADVVEQLSLRNMTTKTETLPQEYIEGEKLLVGEEVASARRRYSGITETIVPIGATLKGKAQRRRPSGGPIHHVGRRGSSARRKMRSMSALGTKAFAAPEIRQELREKEDDDKKKSNEALTTCVADYGMIVDAYSVGWTLRVVLTGVPPNATISEYLHHVAVQESVVETGCCGRKIGHNEPKRIVRDSSKIPDDAASMIKALTKPKPEDRMTIREAQNAPWIRGRPDEMHYMVAQGDLPSKHGDPVVPLECAEQLSNQSVSVAQL